MSNSLFDRVGGEEAIMAASRVLYRRIFEDDSLKVFFEDIDMETQTKKMVGFMTWAFDGPEEYRGRDLRESHAELVKHKGLGDEHFDRVAGHVKDTLVELGVPEKEIEEVMQHLGAQRDNVLNR